MIELSFKSIIIKNDNKSGGSYIEFPYNPTEVFGHGGRIKVICFFDDVEYRGSLVKMRTDCHIIGIRKDILLKIGKKEGDTVSVLLKEDFQERTVEIHPLLKMAFNEDITLLHIYQKLSFTKKKEINTSLEEAKKGETKSTRLEKILKELKDKN